MALATTCPQCKTSFKVVPDQLKLRRGLVRCGVCQHVFSGIDYLRYVDDAARAAQRAARERAAAQGTAPGAPGAPGVPESSGGPGGPGAFGAPTAPLAGGSSQVASGPMPDRGRPSGIPAAIAASGTTAPVGAGAGSATGRAGAGAGLAASDPAMAAPTSPVAGGGLVTAAGGTSGAFARSGLPDPGSDAAWPGAATSPPASRSATPASPHDAVPAATPDAPTGLPARSPDLADTPIRALAPGMDPWAAAAHAAHERSLRDDPPASAAFALAGSIVSPPAPADAPASPPPVRVEGATPVAGFPDPAATEPRAGSAPAPAERPAMRDADGLPALPAPAEGRRPPTPDLDELLARPTRAWPPADGPQTIIPADEDLKTAFFLPDTAIGPAQSEPPSRPREAVEPDPITLLRPEGRSASDDEPRFEPPADAVVSEPSPAELAPRAPRDTGSAIDYFPGRHTRSRGLGLALSPVAWAAAAALSLLLVVQAVVGWRDGIAARAPWLAPVLGALLSPFDVTLRPPRDLDALTIEGFELQAAGGPDALQLSAVLRNRSGHVVGFPAMELTLTDSVGALLVRKVIPAEAYLPDAQQREAGLPGGTERPLRLALEHGGLQPTGFAVALFYP